MDTVDTADTSIDLKESIRQCEQIIDQLDVEQTSSSAFQQKLRDCVKRLENVTLQISKLGIFSPNEHYSELPTGHLRFLLLPVFLGRTTQVLTDEQSSSENGVHSTKSRLDIAEIYFKDFLTRLKSYGIIDYSLDWEESDGGKANTEFTAASHSLAVLSKRRELKLKRYREKEEFKKTIRPLTDSFSNQTDEETLRDLYLAQLKFWAIEALEQLEGIERERPMIEHMIRRSKEQQKNSDDSLRINDRKNHDKGQIPIIITRDRFEKQVFGLGYPSVPILTVDEWYSQMSGEGWFSRGSAVNEKPSKNDQLDEEENESDLRRARAMDEYKDDHRRGYGNTFNKG